MLKPDNSNTDIDLFNLIAVGDQEAYKLLYERYRDELFGTAVKLTKSYEKSEEIIQELFINLWVSRSRLPVVKQPDAYIFRSLFNKINDYLRRESNWSRIIRDSLSQQPNYENSTEELMDLRESEKYIAEALAKLPEQQRIAYVLNRQKGLSIEEVAIQMGVSPNTVKTHLYKALSFVRAYLKDVATAISLLSIFRENVPFT